MTKRLKPGQLCTIKGHVYRCKKAPIDLACDCCQHESKKLCIMGSIFGGFINGSIVCKGLFGIENYPVLVK